MKWTPSVDSGVLKGDLTAGVMVAAMLVPEAMAYAMLAGLPPVTGRYAAAFPLLAYAALGSSRHLAVGPVAIVSLLVGAACTRIAAPGSSEYLAAVAILTVLTGLIQLGLGLAKAGFLAHFVSRAVISGFTSAAAFVIIFSQLKHLLGIDLDHGARPLALWFEVMHRLGETHGPTLVLGATAGMILFACRRWWPHFPAALPVVAAGTPITYAARLDRFGIRVVGTVPSGMPRLAWPATRPDLWLTLTPAALTIVFVGFMESMAIAQCVATQDTYRDIERYPQAETDPACIMIRVDASLYFANARFVEDRIRERLAVQTETEWVVMDMAGVNDIDAVAVATLEDLMEDCRPHNIRFAFAGIKGPVRDILIRAQWRERLGTAIEYPTLRAAAAAIRSRPESGSASTRR